MSDFNAEAFDSREEHVEAWLNGDALAPSRTGTKQVYLIEHPLGFYKIGVARFSDKRVKALQTGSPFELTVRSWVTTTEPHEVESDLHDILSEYHVRGEWFELPENIVEWFSPRRALESDELERLEVLVNE